MLHKNFPVNNSSPSPVSEEPEHLFNAGSESCSLIYPLGRAHATLPSPKFTVGESDSTGHSEALKTTQSYNNLWRFPCALIEIKFPHLTTFLGRFLASSLSSYCGIKHDGL